MADFLRGIDGTAFGGAKALFKEACNGLAFFKEGPSAGEGAALLLEDEALFEFAAAAPLVCGTGIAKEGVWEEGFMFPIKLK